MKESLYGVGSDQFNFVRSDDRGLNWIAITANEYLTVKL